MPPAPLAAGLAGAFVSAFFSFGGWWEVTKVAGEVRDGARTLPRALAAGLALVTLAYAATSVAFLYAIPLDAMRTGDAFAAQLGELLFGRAGGAALAAIVIVSVLGTLSAFMMVTPRLYVAMARDGLFPAWAAAIHPRFGTPGRAIAVQADAGEPARPARHVSDDRRLLHLHHRGVHRPHRGVGVRPAPPSGWPGGASGRERESRGHCACRAIRSRRSCFCSSS